MSELRLSKLHNSAAAPVSSLATLLIAVVVISGLYFGREVLVPIALALLLSFVLAPPVRLFQNCRVPRGAAVVVVVVLAFVIIFGFGTLMVSQVSQLAGSLPSYQSTLREKIQSLRGATAKTQTLERASEVLEDLSKEINRPNSSTSKTPSSVGTPPERPIPVEVRQPDPGALQTLAALITPLIQPLTTAGIVIVSLSLS